jgi:hypothetical protein
MKDKPSPFQFTLKKLLIVTTLIAFLLGCFRYWTSVFYACEASPNTPVFENYFGFSGIESYYPSVQSKDVKARNILVVTGRFQGRGPHLCVILYLVENGKITKNTSYNVGESSSRIGTFFGENLKITIALGDIDTPDGHVVLLGTHGQTAGAGSSGSIPSNVKPLTHKAFAGRIFPGYQYLSYVEGDELSDVTRNMTINEFAKRNSGKYLVVTLQSE